MKNIMQSQKPWKVIQIQLNTIYMFHVKFNKLDLPVVLMFVFMGLKYKKKLNLNTFFFTMINAVMVNEFGKY